MRTDYQRRPTQVATTVHAASSLYVGRRVLFRRDVCGLLIFVSSEFLRGGGGIFIQIFRTTTYVI